MECVLKIVCFNKYTCCFFEKKDDKIIIDIPTKELNEGTKKAALSGSLFSVDFFSYYGFVIVFELRITADCAKTLPLSEAPVFKVIPVLDITIPSKCEFVSNIA